MWYIFENDDEQLVADVDISDPQYSISSHSCEWPSRTSGHPTREELFKHYQVLEKPCVVCGQWIKSTYNNRDEFVPKNMCFSCNIWDNRVREVLASTRKMIVNGYFYTASEDTGGYFRGHGGRKFTFERLDTGEIVESTNVWSGGRIPKIWRDRLPDNAVIHHY